MSLAAMLPADLIHSRDDAEALLSQGMDLLRAEEEAIKGVLARYLRDHHLVEDVYQEVAMKVMRRIESLRDPALLRAWIFQIARNASLDCLRRLQARPRFTGVEHGDLGAGGDLGRNPAEQVLSRERVAAIRRALDRLPPSQQEVLRLRLEDGLDHEGIAERLGISRQAVEVRLCRGRAALREQLSEIMGGEL
jgi:RNA polymerase sigma-70 factor (ECF subfamily)